MMLWFAVASWSRSFAAFHSMRPAKFQATKAIGSFDTDFRFLDPRIASGPLSLSAVFIQAINRFVGYFFIIWLDLSLTVR